MSPRWQTNMKTKSEATQTKPLAVCAPTRKSALYPKAIEDIEVIVCNCVVSLYIFVLYINREEACSSPERNSSLLIIFFAILTNVIFHFLQCLVLCVLSIT